MVLPLVDEAKPKCYVCHQGFEDLNELRIHQKTEHKDFFEFLQRLEVYKQALKKDTSLILSTDSEMFSLFKSTTESSKKKSNSTSQD